MAYRLPHQRQPAQAARRTNCLCAGLPSEFARAGYRPSTYCFVSTENSTMTELRDFKW